MLKENPSASVSSPASSDNPSIMPPQPEQLEQRKFNAEETNFLRTHLLAYEALCQQLGKEATGPRGTGSVKGRKKDWILSKVVPEYVRRFSSDQDGGPQLHSLQAVSDVLVCAKIVAEMIVENSTMVHESLTSSRFRLDGTNYHYFQASTCI